MNYFSFIKGGDVGFKWCEVHQFYTNRCQKLAAQEKPIQKRKSAYGNKTPISILKTHYLSGVNFGL